MCSEFKDVCDLESKFIWTGTSHGVPCRGDETVQNQTMCTQLYLHQINLSDKGFMRQKGESINRTRGHSHAKTMLSSGGCPTPEKEQLTSSHFRREAGSAHRGFGTSVMARIFIIGGLCSSQPHSMSQQYLCALVHRC